MCGMLSSVSHDKKLIMDDRSLNDRIFHPEQPRVVEARDAVADLEDPREAWEALASRGVIPDDWVQQPLRGFARDVLCSECAGEKVRWGQPCRACEGAGRT